MLKNVANRYGWLVDERLNGPFYFIFLPAVETLMSVFVEPIPISSFDSAKQGQQLKSLTKTFQVAPARPGNMRRRTTSAFRRASAAAWEQEENISSPVKATKAIAMFGELLRFCFL